MSMIKSIFYAKFDVHDGPVVLHQVPIGTITPEPSSSTAPLVSWDAISSTVIPRQSTTSLPLTLLTGKNRVLSHPVVLSDPRYPRNEFIFNFGFVLDKSTPVGSYMSIVSKLASMFADLEGESAYLSNDTSPRNKGKIYAVCEILLEDLNNYSETMIPLDDLNTLSLKLFPMYPAPPPLRKDYVPLSTVNLEALTDTNWDLTMLRIIKYIDGVRSIKRIAMDADADYRLVRRALAHLVYYGCVVLLDTFHFGAVYATTEKIGQFVNDADMQDECLQYVVFDDEESETVNGDAHKPDPEQITLTGARLVELYCSLRQGLTLRQWCIEHAELVSTTLDVRRFITFGVLKGFLYRIHRYPFRDRTSALNFSAMTPRIGPVDVENGKTGEAGKSRLDADGTTLITSSGVPVDLVKLGDRLNGMVTFDEICTEFEISEAELEDECLSRFEDVFIISK